MQRLSPEISMESVEVQDSMISNSDLGVVLPYDYVEVKCRISQR